MLKTGDYCYFVENNQRVVKAKILKISGGFYTVLFDENSMMRVKRHRIYESYEEAEKNIRRSPSKKTPYDFYPILGRIPPLLSEVKVGDECRLFFTETIDNQ